MVNLKDRSSSQQNLKDSAQSQARLQSGMSMPQLIKPLNVVKRAVVPRKVTSEKHGNTSTPGARAKLTPGSVRTSTSIKTLTTPKKMGKSLIGHTPRADGKKGNKGDPQVDLPPEDKEIMDLTRRPKDKTFKHVFKGSVLITTLLEYNKDRFESREAAAKFAQKLLEAGHVQSVVASKTFDDGAALYRWGDESVVKEAKKMVATTASHIPKKRIIEMMDLQQGCGPDDAYNIKEVKGKFTRSHDDERQRPPSSASQSGSDVVKRKPGERRYSDQQMAKNQRQRSASGGTESRLPKPKQRSSTIEGQLDSSVRRVPSPARRVRSPEARSTTSPTPMTRSPPPQAQRCEPITFHVQTMPSRSSGLSTPKSHTETVINSTASPVHTEVLSPAPIHIHTEVFVPVMTTRFEAPTFHAPARTFDPPVSTVQHTYERSRHEIVLSPSPSVPPEPLSTARTGTMSPVSQRSDVISPTPVTSSRPHPSSTVSDPPLPDSNPDTTPTCRYDGIDMPALDIDNIDFQILRPPKTTATDIERDIQTLEEQSNCYSDNEKQLLEQMKKMKQEHENVLQSYEDQINELMTKVNDLKSMAEILEQKQDDQGGSNEGESTVPAPPPPPNVPSPPPVPGIPQAPPLPTSSGPPLAQCIQPSKAPIKPRVKMRPLFWNRIILEYVPDKESTFWHQATEPNFDVDEFERLFGRHVETNNNNNNKSLHEAMTPQKTTGKQQAVKLLEDKRSRAVGIKMRSMHCQMEDIREAVYQMNFSRVDLDNLYGVYEIRATGDELEKIELHLQENPDVLLDQPEQFLYELATMPFFKERIECMVHMRRFNETLFNIDQRLSTIQTACEEVKNNEALKVILELVLAFGNYMNGGTQRGQADGFDLCTLTKIRDVKSMDNGMNLLHYVVTVFCKEKEEDAGRGLVDCGLPDPALMYQAAGVNFSDLDTELKGLQHQIEVHSRKANDICANTKDSLLQPFKDILDDFFDSADHMLKDQLEKCKESKESFYSLVGYLTGTADSEQITLEVFFKIWAQFFTDYRYFWNEEQKRIAKEMFEKVDKKRKERLRMAKRRKSIAVSRELNTNGNNNNLKQRFANLRRRSEVQNPTFRLLRSQSVNNIDAPTIGLDSGLQSIKVDVPDTSRDANRAYPAMENKAIRGLPEPRRLDRRARSDSDAYLNYDTSLSSTADEPLMTNSAFSSEQPPPLPASEPPFKLQPRPDSRSPVLSNSYRREVAQPPGTTTSDGLESVFDRMERRRRRGVVVPDNSEYQGQLNNNQTQEPSSAHPLHDRIIRRRLSRSYTDETEDEKCYQNESLTRDEGADGRVVLNAGADLTRRKLSDIKARLGNRSTPNVRSHVVDLERVQRTLPAPPVPPRENIGEFIGSYNVQRASEQRAREERTKREMINSLSADLSAQGSQHSLFKQSPGQSRDSRCSSPSSCSSHSSLDSSRPMRATIVPRMRERTVSEDRDIGALSENEYRDALRKLARARAGSANSLR